MIKTSCAEYLSCVFCWCFCFVLFINFICSSAEQVRFMDMGLRFKCLQVRGLLIILILFNKTGSKYETWKEGTFRQYMCCNQLTIKPCLNVPNHKNNIVISMWCQEVQVCCGRKGGGAGEQGCHSCAARIYIWFHKVQCHGKIILSNSVDKTPCSCILVLNTSRYRSPLLMIIQLFTFERFYCNLFSNLPPLPVSKEYQFRQVLFCAEFCSSYGMYLTSLGVMVEEI